MNKKAIAILTSPIFWIAVAVLLVVIAVASAGDDGDSIFKGKSEILCQVTVESKTFGGVNLVSRNCALTGDNCFNFPELSILKEEGTIEITMNDGARASKKFSVFKFVGDEESYRMKICSTGSRGDIKIVSKEGQILDSGDFSV